MLTVMLTNLLEQAVKLGGGFDVLLPDLHSSSVNFETRDYLIILFLEF